jgi:hypothetical protein
MPPDQFLDCPDPIDADSTNLPLALRRGNEVTKEQGTYTGMEGAKSSTLARHPFTGTDP